jgi:hypothetical protein
VPLVFVHGVNTRRKPNDDTYDSAVKARDDLFREYCLTAVAADPREYKIFNPYWGDEAARFPWNYGFAHDSQPDLEAFGADNDALDDALWDAGVEPVASQQNDILLRVARRNFRDAVNLLWTAAGTTSHLTDEDAETLARVSHSVDAYVEAQADTAPVWLSMITTDGQFIERLIDEVEEWSAESGTAISDGQELESFGSDGLLNRLKKGALRVADRAADAAFGKVAESKLPKYLRRFSLFFGDVFEYIRQRASGKTAITDVVVVALREASKLQQTKGERVVCIGHSMGGDILYDLLTDTSLADLPTCDLFITVGSQVGLFEELKLFRSSDAQFPPNAKTRVPRSRHPRIKRWINVFDRSDPFGYPASTIFEGVEDYVFDTRAFTLSAHGAYFLQPTFHARLRARIAQS